MPRSPHASAFLPVAGLARRPASAAARVAVATAIQLCAPIVPGLSGFVRAEDTTIVCTHEPRTHWMSAAAISQRAVQAGYPDIRHVTIVGTCYKIDARTAQRLQADVVMDPVTGDVLQAWMGPLPE